MISPKYLIYHDLIGFGVKARLKSKSTHTEFIDIGKVIDETHNMIITEINSERRNFVKKDYIFRFKLNDDLLEVDADTGVVRKV